MHFFLFVSLFFYSSRLDRTNTSPFDVVYCCSSHDIYDVYQINKRAADAAETNEYVNEVKKEERKNFCSIGGGKMK